MTTPLDSTRHLGAITILELRQELERFVSDTLSRELLPFSDRVEQILDAKLKGRVLSEFLIKKGQRRDLSYRSVVENGSRLEGSVSHRDVEFSMQPDPSNIFSHFSTNRSTNRSRAPTRMSRVSVQSQMQSVSSLETRFAGSEYIDGSARGDFHRQPSDDQHQLHVRKFPKRGATSTVVVEEEPLINGRVTQSRWATLRDMRHRFRKGFWQGEEEKNERKRTRMTFGRLRKSMVAMETLSARASLRPQEDCFESESEAPPTALQALVDSDCFNSLIVWLIILNMIYIAFETDYLARNWSRTGPFWFKIFDTLFCAAFAIEMTLRVASDGIAYFFDAGNIFDALMVACQVIETVIAYWTCVSMRHTTMQFRALRLLRIFRMIRVTRVFRLIQHVRELKLLLQATGETLRPLIWMLLPLAMMSNVFAILLTQLATEYKLAHASDIATDSNLQNLEMYYGSVDRAFLGLYQMISEGTHWGEFMQPLAAYASPWIQIIFVFYVAVTVLGMMNVIMGIFVDSVSRAADQSKKRNLIDQMKKLFEECDTQGNGTVEWEGFESQLNNPQMLAYLKDIDLDREQAIELFKLLDVESSGSIDPQDWLSGCLSLAGPAQALDLAMVLHDLREFIKKWTDHADKVEVSLFNIEAEMHKSYLVDLYD